MKYLFLIVLSFTIGYFLPTVAAGLRVALIVLSILTACGVTLYMIDKYVNAVRS